MRKSNLRATAAWQALALLGAGALATPAMAQDAPPASGETSPAAEAQPALSDKGKAEASDEAIVVTGSRLVRPELDAPSPVTTVDSETFDLTGDNQVTVYVPAGCAHGFQALTEPADVSYRIDRAHDPSEDVAIRFDDRDVGAERIDEGRRPEELGRLEP